MDNSFGDVGKCSLVIAEDGERFVVIVVLFEVFAELQSVFLSGLYVI
jgi:hypothetical protein